MVIYLLMLWISNILSSYLSNSVLAILHYLSYYTLTGISFAPTVLCEGIMHSMPESRCIYPTVVNSDGDMKAKENKKVEEVIWTGGVIRNKEDREYEVDEDIDVNANMVSCQQQLSVTCYPHTFTISSSLMPSHYTQ
ncbi:hypothetical protein BDQ17DRAFT_1334596 [Cyathus striatus]|nr:hypothetical protein BDQ17DRAFT_1334596 [Cyathus striatus]